MRSEVLIKCENLTQCLVALKSKEDMIAFLADRTNALGKELTKLEKKPSLFSLIRVGEIQDELALIAEVQSEIISRDAKG